MFLSFLNSKLSTAIITQTYTAPSFTLEAYGVFTSETDMCMAQKIININTPSGYRIASITPKSGEWVIQCTVVDYNPNIVIVGVVNLFPQARTSVNFLTNY